MDLGDRDYTFDGRWFEVIRFFDLPYIYTIVGHISLWVKIYRSSWSHMTLITYEIHTETMTYQLSYQDLLGEPLLSHSVRPVLFSILMSSCFSFWDTLFWFVDPIQLRTWMTKITHLVMDDLVSSGFSTYHTFDAILGHISVLIGIYKSSLICMIILSHEIHAELMTRFHFVLIL